MALLPVPKNAQDIGECIYCGSCDGPLGKEHAVPFGLNGPWTLLRASCPVCANITHRFERDTLRGLFPAIRAVLAMQTRRPRERPRMLPLVLESNGTQQTVHVPLSEFPTYLPTPVFPPPGIVVGRAAVDEMPVDLQFRHIAGPQFESVAKRYPGTDFVGARLSFSPIEFARTIAKIALCAAVFVLGIAPLRNSPIRKVVLGRDRRVSHWVGSWSGEQVNEPTGLHAMQVRASGSDLHVVLRLFAQFNAPEYHVALGPADPKFVQSTAWPWK